MRARHRRGCRSRARRRPRPERRRGNGNRTRKDEPKAALVDAVSEEVRALCFEPQLSVDVIAGERPGEALVRLDTTHEQLTARNRSPKEGRSVVTANLPARALRNAAPVGLDTGDARPPVGKMMRLGDE